MSREGPWGIIALDGETVTGFSYRRTAIKEADKRNYRTGRNGEPWRGWRAMSEEENEGAKQVSRGQTPGGNEK